MANRLGWSAEEAAEQLGIGRSVMFELIRTGQVRSVKIRRRRIVPDEALRQYMAELIKSQCGHAEVG
jgi:excisionase family DNA binding protein